MLILLLQLLLLLLLLLRLWLWLEGLQPSTGSKAQTPILVCNRKEYTCVLKCTTYVTVLVLHYLRYSACVCTCLCVYVTVLVLRCICTTYVTVLVYVRYSACFTLFTHHLSYSACVASPWLPLVMKEKSDFVFCGMFEEYHTQNAQHTHI